MNVSLRPASSADIDVLTRLNEQVQRLHAELEPTHFKSNIDPEVTRRFFELLLQAPGNFIIMAEWEAAPAGYLWFQVQDRPEGPFTFARKLLYIHHVVVDETARRKGIASALLAQVEQEASKAGIDHIALDTWAANSAAQSFFQARGLAPRNIILQKALAVRG